MKLLVTGGRDYKDQHLVTKTLNQARQKFGEFLLIQGGAPGADTLARNWAVSHGYPCATFHAPWTALGKPAGMRRNGWMLEYGQPDLVVAFPGGPGTAGMISLAEAAGVKVVRI